MQTFWFHLTTFIHKEIPLKLKLKESARIRASSLFAKPKNVLSTKSHKTSFQMQIFFWNKPLS